MGIKIYCRVKKQNLFPVRTPGAVHQSNHRNKLLAMVVRLLANHVQDQHQSKKGNQFRYRYQNHRDLHHKSLHPPPRQVCPFQVQGLQVPLALEAASQCPGSLASVMGTRLVDLKVFNHW